MIWRRSILLSLLTVTGLALETSVMGRLTLFGVKPELLLLMTVALAMGEGPEVGATAGFVMGLMTDLVVPQPQGVYALTLTVVGYAVGRVRAQLQTPSAWLPIGMVFVSTVAGVAFYGSFNILLGQGSIGLVGVIRNAGLAALYNALLTPFVFPLVRGLAAHLRPAGVVTR